MTRAGAPRRLGVLLQLGGSLGDLDAKGQLGRVLDHYLPAWLTAFDEVVVFTYSDEALEDVVPDARAREGLRLVRVPGPRQRHLAAARLAYDPKLRAELRACDALRALQAPGALPAVLARRPFVCTYGYAYDAFTEGRLRGVRERLIRGLLSLVLGRARIVIVTSRAGEAEARGLGARTVARIPNGVDLRGFAAVPRDPARDRGPRPVVAFVGRLAGQKDLPTLIEAAARMPERPVLRLIGDGPLRDDLVALAARRDVTLELPGAVAHAELPARLADADAFALPSHIEGHPKALIEAMALGLPCVGSDIPSITELQPGVSLFRQGDPDALAAALSEVLGDPAGAEALGAQARRTAERRFDLHALLAEEAALLDAEAQARVATTRVR